MTKLYKFQREGVTHIDLCNGRALIADSMGLGKTLQALTWLKWSKCPPPIIVVCPATIKPNWQHEALKHIGMRSEMLFGRKPPKQPPFDLAPMLIINYDILHWWVPYLRKLKPQCVILDEAQKVKTPTAKMSRACKRLCERVPHVIALTGTPIENNPAELWHIMSILQPTKAPWKQGFTAFAHAHSHAKLTPWGWQFKGVKDARRLHKLLLPPNGCMIRRLKSEVLKDLPQRTRNVVVVELDNPQEYELAQKDFLHWFAQHRNALRDKRNKGRRKLKASQRAKLSYLKQLAGRKLQAVTEWLDNWLADCNEKMIVFAIHHAVVDHLHEYYGKMSVKLNGLTPAKQRKLVQDQFNDDPRIRLLIGNVHAAGVGWSSKHPNTCTVELDWKPATHNQADDRTHGINRGGGLPVTNWYILADGTIEESICRMHSDKQAISDAVIDGKFDKEVGTLDIYDQLCLELEKGNGFHIG